jgi:hypothetical protein
MKGDVRMPVETRLTVEECHAKAVECRKMATRTREGAHVIMLEHMAETWERICRDLKESEPN